MMVGGWKALGIIAAAGVLGLAGRFAANWALDQQRQQRFEANLEKIISLLTIPDQAEPTARFDAVRRFINGHSHHAVDAEFRKLHGDRNLIAEGIIAHAKGQSSEPVHLECSTRSNLLASVLHKLGYETRIVAIFDTDDDALRSHSFVDVLNPETGKWESQDPDYDLYWTNKTSGQRVSLADAAEDLSDLEPCHDSSSGGWAARSTEGKSASKLRDYIDIISVTDKASDMRFSRFTTRAKPDRIFTVNGRRGRFCDLMAKRCAQGLRPD